MRLPHNNPNQLSTLQRELRDLTLHLVFDSALLLALLALLCLSHWLASLLTISLGDSSTRILLVIILHGAHEVPVCAAAVNTLLVSLRTTTTRILSIWRIPW